MYAKGIGVTGMSAICTSKNQGKTLPEVVFDQPIFRSVEQALHISFMMEILPVMQKSQMQIVLERMIKEMRAAEEHEQRTINFSGLSPLEIRGQCAMVRGAVEHHLLKQEADAIHARYGFQSCKANGVRGVRDYCLPMMTIRENTPTLAMAWGIYGTKQQKEDLSSRRIAEQFSISQSSVSRNMRIIRDTGILLIDRGVDHLKSIFERGNILEQV